MALPDLDAFLSPRAIAVVGASASPHKIGAVPLRYLREHGFAGALYPINPAYATVQGLAAYPSLQAVGRPIDLAVFAVPAAQAEAALEDAVAAGVRHLVMFSAGFAEAGPEGAAAQQRFAARARAAGIRVLGPNCLGFMNLRHAVYATFSPVVATGRAVPGPVGIVSQSGAFGAYAYGLARARGLGLSAWVTTGNESDIHVAEVIAWMARDPGTRVIMAYMEGCPDGTQLKEALALARAAAKPVVVVKVGRTALGAETAASHTAALAGDDAAFDALFRQYGAWRARGIEEFFDVAHGLAVGGLPSGASVGLLTVSGGVGVLMADEASDAGLDVAPLPVAARERILARAPLAAVRNPVDLTGQVTAEPELLGLAARTMLEEGGYGSLLVFLAAAGLGPDMQALQRRLARELRREFPGRLLVFSTLPDAQHERALEAEGSLAFTDPGRAIRVLAAMAFFRARFAAAPAPAEARAAVEAASARADTPTRVRLRGGACNEADALELLQAHGVAAPARQRATTAAQAVAAAQALGYPVVMKVLSADILHKSDVGGVVLGITDAAQAAQAHDHILTAVHARVPDARVDGVLVARMQGRGVECILGAHRDPVLGPVVMLGAGGVQAELLRDVVFRLAPVELAEARAMVSELRTGAALAGYRGAPKADVEALAGMVVALSRFAVAAGDTLDTVELNPVLVLPEGQGAVALDAVVVGRAV